MELAAIGMKLAELENHKVGFQREIKDIKKRIREASTDEDE
jgi:hypothetical protein